MNRPAFMHVSWGSVVAWSVSVSVLVLVSVSGHAANIDQSTMPIPVAGGAPVEARIFTVDPSKIYIDVLPASLIKQGRDRLDGGDRWAGSEERSVSLKDAANSSVVGRVMLQRTLLVNGGFSDDDRPDGLLIARDQVVSLPNFANRAADPASACPAMRGERKKLSGALCIARDRSASIKAIENVKAADCYQALQAGPLLVAPGGLVDACPVLPGNAQKTAAQQRTVLCLRGSQLSVVLATAPIALGDLAKWLAAPANSGGLACDSALNLAGGEASGAVYFPGSLSKRIFWGGKTQANASYLLIHSMKY